MICRSSGLERHRTDSRAFNVDGVSCLHNDFEETRSAAYSIHKAVGFKEIGRADGIIRLEIIKEDYLSYE